jgi:hypothetical protein
MLYYMVLHVYYIIYIATYSDWDAHHVMFHMENLATLMESVSSLSLQQKSVSSSQPAIWGYPKMDC